MSKKTADQETAPHRQMSKKNADEEANRLLVWLDEASVFAKDSNLPEALKLEIAKKLGDAHGAISRWLSNANKLN